MHGEAQDITTSIVRSGRELISIDIRFAGLLSWQLLYLVTHARVCDLE